jgi:hypothetical protein
MAFPQISTPEQRRQWQAQGMEIEPTTGMPVGSILRNGDGNYVQVAKDGLISITEAQAQGIIKGFEKNGSN